MSETQCKKTEKAGIIWPEWNDAEVNAEKWDLAKPAGKATPKDKKSTKASTTPSVITIPEFGFFEDTYPAPLPETISSRCNQWMRLSTLYPGVKLIIFTLDPPYPDLVSLNLHILNSELIRSMIASVYNLMYLGFTHPFPVEWQTPTYNANTGSGPWKPWHHIYSMCKAGEGSHNPQVNNSGKYVVRLFWMGCWRKIIVDDRMAVDSSLKLLLPCTNNINKLEFEIWPLLLAKALMKLASLTWTATQELAEFDIVTSLTGWVVQKIDTTGLGKMEVWNILSGFSDSFMWEEEIVIDPKAKGKKPKAKGKDEKPKHGLESKAYLTIAVCEDLDDKSTQFIPNITPCVSHGFLIDQIRDIPLTREPDPDKILPLWKEVRWLDWAIGKGLWEPVEKPGNITHCKIISNLIGVSTNTSLDREPSKSASMIQSYASGIDKHKSKVEFDKKAKEKGSKTSKVTVSKGSVKGAKKAVIPEPEDPSIWCQYFNIADHIIYLNIYFKPSQFHTAKVITDLVTDTKGKTKPTKKAAEPTPSSKIIWLNGLKKTHNEPIYLFMDSMVGKFVVFNLSHVGDAMPKPVPKVHEDDKKICTKEICKKGLCVEYCFCQGEESLVEEEEEIRDMKTQGSVIIEEYIWGSRKMGDMILFLSTFGSKSLTFDFEGGRNIWKIWLQSTTNLVLTILSDTDIIVGPVEEILDHMSNESQIVLRYSYNLCTAFGDLVTYYGQSQFEQSLKNYYKTYMPKKLLHKKDSFMLHNCFKEELLNSLNHYCSPTDKDSFLRALRVLFIDPNLKFPNHQFASPRKPVKSKSTHVEEVEICVCIDPDEEKLKEKSAVILQSFFKMIYVQKLKQKHNPFNNKYAPTYDVLRQIYMVLFSTKPRLTVCPELFRNLTSRKELQLIKHTLPYYNEIEKVISINKISGTTNDNKQNSWFPLTRFNFHIEQEALIRVYLSCDFPEYVLRIFDNDTNHEIERYTNNALVSVYKKNEAGYTVVAYGWTDYEIVNICAWVVTVVSQKQSQESNVTIFNTPIETTVSLDEYIPNMKNKIFRYLITVQETTYLTFRLSVSSENVKICLKCLTNTGETIQEIIGTTKLILPFVPLKLNMPQSSTNSAVNLNGIDHKENKKSEVIKSKSSIKKISDKTGLEKKVVDSASITDSAQIISKMSVENINNIFAVEAYVLDDSWPLTLEEWERIEERKMKDNIEEELISTSPSTAELSKRPQDLSKKKLTPNKSASRQSRENKRNIKKVSSEILEPYWTLITVHNKDIGIIIEKDNRRIEEIKEIKRKCFDNMSERLMKGKQIRQEFLDKFTIVSPIPSELEILPEVTDGDQDYLNVEKIKSAELKSIENKEKSESYVKTLSILQTQSTSVQRENSETSTKIPTSTDFSMVCPECFKTILPQDIKYTVAPKCSKLDLPVFNLNNIFEFNYYRQVITKEDEAQFLKDQEDKINKFNEDQEAYLENTYKYYNDIREKTYKLEHWYEEIYTNSSNILLEREIAKDKYIQRVKDEEAELALAAKASPKKGKK